MISQTESRIRKVVIWLASSVGMVTVFAIPAGYFYVSYLYETEHLQSLAELSSDIVSEFVYLHPDTWQLQGDRLEQLLEKSHSRQEIIRYRIIDSKGAIVMSSGLVLETPLLARHAPVSDSGRTVGHVEVAMSLWPEISDTLLIGVISLLLGTVVYFILRIFPMRTLTRVMSRLEQSQKALQREVEAKEEALSKAREAGEAMRHLALHDNLTGLPNRALFQDRLDRAIIYAERAGSRYAVVMMDMDRFKEINDTLGHHIGDQLLQEVALRLKKELRKSDTISRLGGDEFAIILTVADVEDAIAMTQKLRNVLREPINLKNCYIRVDVSCGIAMVAEHGSDAQSLLQHADVAMYTAKRNGTGIAIYDVSEDPNSPRRLQRINDLRVALDQDGLSLCYQPQIDLKTNEIIGVEALARWELTVDEWVSPGEFITLAEETGLIDQLTLWVLDKALQECAVWQQQGIRITVGVNLSARNLHDHELPAHVRGMLDRHGVAPSSLVLEITESAIMEDPGHAMSILNELHGMGIILSVDDFGTGYSSLAYLKELPLHEVKIDRSFVSHMRNIRNDEIIVRSTIDLAHNLGLKVVAEGIEDAETAAMLRKMNCDFAQGYHICHPKTAKEFLGWLRRRDATPEHFSED
ncbi:MAG: hypothetical protein A2V90_05970 [Gammaproteobacteria bacterium RBG_16_57_12]|nr:MAG: hypothetical protein A2V90_05970 [Gammaproteobacteria bacterium RBG_16_57_12]